MSIQSNINQSLSVASLLFSQSPYIKEKAETYNKIRGIESNLKKEKGVIKTSLSALKSEMPDINKMSEEELANYETKKDITLDYASKGIDKAVALRKELFETKPTEANYEKYVQAAQAVPEARKITGSLREGLDSAIARAKEALGAERSRIGSSRYITEALKNEPTSLGGTVGELDPKLQEAIAQQIKSQRGLK